MKKIIIIGAGIGGLSVARTLSDSDFEVTVFEKRNRKDIAYDWHDDIAPSVFERINMQPIDKIHCFPKADWTFIAPDSKKPIKLTLPETTERDISVERKPLSEYLISLSIDKVKFLFDTTVEKLIIKNEKVCGVIVNGKALECDLVIDSSGVDSPFRKSLPESYLIQRNYKADEIFHAYRGFFERTLAPSSEYTNKAYLLHMGEQGISWCIDQNKYVDVLIGRLGKINKTTIDNAMEKLREDNPILGDNVLRGGIVCQIPVRYPLPVMVGFGYAAIGDCAFMTIPMIGSGIVCSLISGYELGKLLKLDCEKEGFDIDTLWQYQLSVYKEFGCKNSAVDAVKRWAISKATPKQIKVAMETGIIDKDNMICASTGEPIILNIGQLLQKLKKGIFHLPTLISMSTILIKSNKAMKLCEKIPKKYDLIEIGKWSQKLEKLLTK